VVFGGVDTEKFSPDGSTASDGTVLFVGRLLPHKGVNDFIDAIEPGTRAEVIGPAPDERYRHELESRAQGKEIVFRHDCSDRALVEAYRRAGCVVLPSVYRDMYGGESRVPELLGQTLLEGMACGVPGVCTDVASLPEVIDHGVTGLVVPPNDPFALRAAIRWMREHPDARREMGARGRRRVMERFRWPVVVKRCLEIYEAPLRRAA
jgi:glycosyltransferase involved in cell wall biosynthesis